MEVVLGRHTSRESKKDLVEAARAEELAVVKKMQVWER